MFRSSLKSKYRCAVIPEIVWWDGRARPCGLSRASYLEVSLWGKGYRYADMCASRLGVNCLDEAVRAPQPMTLARIN